MKKLVVLSGAGISKGSGIPTFRDNDGLWRTYRFDEVTTPAAWQQKPKLVKDFHHIKESAVIGMQKFYDYIGIKM